jgi:hypothetical protein
MENDRVYEKINAKDLSGTYKYVVALPLNWNQLLDSNAAAGDEHYSLSIGVNFPAPMEIDIPSG